MLGGTVAAASALVVASTPRNKVPFAMGLRPVFGVAGGLFMLIGVAVGKLLIGIILERPQLKG